MTYHQVTFAERYTLDLLRRQGLSPAAIARVLGRHRSTILREVRRNRKASDSGYRSQMADWYARGRWLRSGRNRRFSPADLQQVRRLLVRLGSLEQVASYLRRHQRLRISHETIYRSIRADKRAGGMLHIHLRGARKQRRKRYGAYDSRGRSAPSRRTMVPSSTTTRPPSGAPVLSFASRRHTMRGNAEPTKTPAGSFVSTCPRDKPWRT